MNLTTVDVPLKETPYQIQIGSGNLPQLGSLLAAHAPTKLFLIYDENVEMHFRKIESSLTADFECNSFKVPAGEKSKSIQQASSIWEFFAEKRADRKSMVVAIGGGVIGDLAGFIAATFARGIPFFQVPTTLLAHVDSSGDLSA